VGKPKGDYGLESLIKSTEEALQSLGDVARLTVGLSRDSEDDVEDQIRREQLRGLAETYGVKTDSYVEATISTDGMKAIMDFFPATGGGRILEPGDVAAELWSRGIVFGIDDAAWHEAMLRCNTEGVPVNDVVVACGAPAVPQVPAHFEIEPGLLEKPHLAGSIEDLRVDYRETVLPAFVNKGALLAKVTPPRPGQMGNTVRGEALPYGIAAVQNLTPGKNTERKGNEVCAACEGRFERDTSSFWVNQVLRITDKVDYRTGHIRFPGDVVVHGEIQDGFKVHAGGSLHCHQTLNASDVACQKDLLVEKGIIGRMEATVRVGGEVRARFIENCYLEARGSVNIQVGILNSAVHTLGRLVMGTRGIIVGGRVHAQEGVVAAQVGSSMGPRTEIYCGLDYTILHRLEYIRSKSMELAMRLSSVEMKKKMPGAELERLAAVETKIRGAIHELNNAAQTLIHHLDKNDAAQVTVTEMIHPGAYVEICHASFVVTRPLRRVRFCLDKTTGKVKAVPL
jgi:uncharacterized protein